MKVNKNKLRKILCLLAIIIALIMLTFVFLEKNKAAANRAAKATTEVSATEEPASGEDTK